MIEISKNDETIPDIVVEYNTLRKSIFDMKISNVSNNDLDIIFFMQYIESDDTLFISCRRSADNALIHSDNIAFKDFKDKYGLDFLKKFIDYLMNVYKCNEMEYANINFKYNDFCFIYKYSNFMIIKSDSNNNNTEIGMKLKDSNGNRFINSEKIMHVFTNNLKDFYNAYNAMINSKKENNDTERIERANSEVIFNITSGKIIIANNKINIIHSYNGIEYCRTKIPVDILDTTNTERSLLLDLNFYTINTTCNSSFIIRFDSPMETKRFIKYIRSLAEGIANIDDEGRING